MAFITAKKAAADAAAAGVAAKAALANTLKKGKSPEQCKAIDFFVIGDSAKDLPESKGCLKKVNKMLPAIDKNIWSMDEYLLHVQNFVDDLDLKQRAMDKIGLDESQISEIDPIVLASFGRGDGLYWRKDRERHIYVTNKYYVTWIFFSATQLYTHTYEFDTTSDNVTETTRDFFYSDVTCIKTEHEIEEEIYAIKEPTKGCLPKGGIKGCLKKPAEPTYVRNHIHWDTLKITVPNNDYSFCCRTTPTIEQSLQAAKAMIREKKQA